MTQAVADLVGAAIGWDGAQAHLADHSPAVLAAAQMTAEKLGYIERVDVPGYPATMEPTSEGIAAVLSAMDRGEVAR